jgi:hypothetical protein
VTLGTAAALKARLGERELLVQSPPLAHIREIQHSSTNCSGGPEMVDAPPNRR